MSEFIPIYEVGERVNVWLGEWQHEGTVVAVEADIEPCPYCVQLDKDEPGEERWFEEDDLDIIPTSQQIRQFAALVDRVYQKLTVNKQEDHKRE